MSGKIPTRTKIETFFKKGVWDVLREEFTKCENKETAANRLSHLTQGKISITPITILNMVKNGIDSGEVTNKDFFYSWGIQTKNGNGHRGKKPVREKIEKYIGKNMWEWLRAEFTNCKNKEEASEQILEATNIKMTGAVLISTIEKGLENKEVNTEDFFVKWIVRKKHRAKKTETKTVSNGGIEEAKIKMTGTCSNCGQKAVIAITPTNLITMGIGIRGKRCPGCQMWASFVFTGEVNGKQYTEEYKDWKKNNQDKFKKELAQA